MKKNVFPLLLNIAAIALLIFVGACTKTNIVEIPPPDYIDIMTKAGTFKMFKVFDSGTAEDRLFKSRDTDVVIKKSASADEVLFEETFLQNGVSVTVTYRVRLVDAKSASNAVKLSIPEQTISNNVYAGFIHPSLQTEKLQGFFEAFSATDTKTVKTPVNNLIFAITVNGERWLYSKK
ncbi:MAG: hypothetical protein EAZ08_13040 [Cytophagales bacterium]|nr:MAG: hypothetical protein EAZ08_13040 [Cytophagales bacterium]